MQHVNHCGSGLQTAIFFSIALATATTAIAQPNANFGYTYAEGGYRNVDLDGYNADGDGIFLAGSLQVHDQVFLALDYDWGDFDRGIETDRYEIGAGLIVPMAPDLDVLAQLGYIDTEIDTRFGDVSENGYYASGGARWMVNEQIELSGELKYVDLDDTGDDVVVEITGLVNVRPRLSVLGGLEFADDSDTINIGFRYYFDRVR